MGLESTSVGTGGTGHRGEDQGAGVRGRVVVGVDGSPGGRAALAWAMRAAVARGASLEVLSAYAVDYYWSDAYLLDPRRMDDARRNTEVWTRRLVDEVRKDVADAGVPEASAVETVVLVAAGAAAERLVDRSRNADVLVVGSRGRGAVASALLGSVSLRCSMHAHCPTVVVHEGDRPGRPEGRRPTVVVGVDGSPTARSALEVAAAEARRLDARLRVVAAFRTADTWSDVGGVDAVAADELRRSVESAVTADVTEVLGGEAAPDRPVVDLEVVEGAPADVLVHQAEGADLLVVGTRGQATLPGLVLGSVALRVLIRAACPVMVVHPTRAPVADGSPNPDAVTAPAAI